MSIFMPYTPEVILTTLTTWFSLDLSTLTDYQTIILTIVTNAYFFGFWFFILYFVIKGLNRVYERIF